VHRIEAESMEMLSRRVDLSHHAPGVAAVIARVIHATADLDYARTMVVPVAAVEAGVSALRADAPVVTDVEMVRHGLSWPDARCYLDEVREGAEPTRTAAAMRLAAHHHPAGSVVVVGCAPTALAEVVRLARSGDLRPALVIGLPVGFVGAAEAKTALRRAPGVAAITNVGVSGRRWPPAAGS
jgi:precorrin-8X/cobalt-precorrin-8 methylmutase